MSANESEEKGQLDPETIQKLSGAFELGYQGCWPAAGLSLPIRMSLPAPPKVVCEAALAALQARASKLWTCYGPAPLCRSGTVNDVGRSCWRCGAREGAI